MGPILGGTNLNANVAGNFEGFPFIHIRVHCLAWCHTMFPATTKPKNHLDPELRLMICC